MPKADVDCDWKAKNIENEDGDGQVAVLIEHGDDYFLAVSIQRSSGCKYSVE